MDLVSFTYKGKEFQVDKAAEMEAEAGKKCIQVVTTDNREFILTFNKSLYQWTITESTT